MALIFFLKLDHRGISHNASWGANAKDRGKKKPPRTALDTKAKPPRTGPGHTKPPQTTGNQQTTPGKRGMEPLCGAAVSPRRLSSLAAADGCLPGLGGLEALLRVEAECGKISPAVARSASLPTAHRTHKCIIFEGSHLRTPEDGGRRRVHHNPRFGGV